jgi:ribonuclease HII
MTDAMTERFAGKACLIGIDEVGRGPLAGPVAVCACMVAADFDMARLSGIRDSKKLSTQKREAWFANISAMKAEGSLDFAYAAVSAADIDASGIASAIRRAVAECLDALHAPHDASHIFLDGSLHAPARFIRQETIIKGDEKVPIISAASIVAKVLRDRSMDEEARRYPAYGFDAHKGYGTAAHRTAIKRHGITPLHRKSFLTKILAVQ